MKLWCLTLSVPLLASSPISSQTERILSNQKGYLNLLSDSIRLYLCKERGFSIHSGE